MPIAVTRDVDRHRLIIAVTGNVDFQEIGRFIQTDTPLPADVRSFDIVVDLRDARIVGGTSVHAHALALLAADQDPERTRGRIAIVASEPTAFGAARMYATYRASHGLTVRVFETIEQADSWLAGGPRA